MPGVMATVSPLVRALWLAGFGVGGAGGEGASAGQRCWHRRPHEAPPW
eukprot:COSAG02_NODE_20931_length_809_cov_1.461972_1_plen_47_part_10